MKGQTDSLYLKYRPQSFDDVIGNEATIISLKSILSRPKDKIPHVFLFAGPYGVGKTTLAYIVAKELGCDNEHDLYKMDAGTERSVDDADNLKRSARFRPLGGGAAVYIIDEIQETSAKFQGSLLKILEDTPKHAYFIICTTDPQKINKGITSGGRSQRYQLESLSETQLLSLLHRVGKSEGVKVPKNILTLVAEAAKGSARACLSILDQIISLKDPEDMKNVIFNFEVDEREVKELCQALLYQKSWKEVSTIIKGISVDPEKMRYAVLGYCSAVLLNNKDAKSTVSRSAALVMECFKDSFFYTKKAGLVLACDKVIN